MKVLIIIKGVACNEVSSQYGQYSISLPIFDGGKSTFNAICLESITSAMPFYPVAKVRKVIEEDFVKQGGNSKNLPQVPHLLVEILTSSLAYSITITYLG